MLKLTEHGTPALNTVHHARAEALLSALDSASVDLVVTSPPYDNLRTYNGFSWNFEYIAQQTYRVLKPGGVLVWVVGDATIDGSESLTSFEQALYFKRAKGFKAWDTMIWNKYLPGDYGKRYVQAFEYMFIFSKGEPRVWNPVMQRNAAAGKTRPRAQRSGYQTDNGYQLQGKTHIINEFGVMENVWRISTEPGFEKHPAAFPEDLVERHILTWSNPGDLVLDYFGGSGTTAKMARKNGRRWLTGDISGEYCALMERRLNMPYTPMFEELITA